MQIRGATSQPIDPRVFKLLNRSVVTHPLIVADGEDQDHDRYLQIIKGKLRKDLKGFISPDKMKIIKGGKIVVLPKPTIVLPRFTRGTPQEGGVGAGEGDEGDQIGQVGDDGNAEPGEAGSEPGEHSEEVWGIEVSRSEIAEMIMEELSLPNLQPKGSENIKETDIKWTLIEKLGTQVHLDETVKAAIKRTILEKGEINPEDIVIQPGEDLQFYSYSIEERPEANAVIFYVMDVSGSMGEEQKQMVRTASFYLSTIIQHQFGKLNADLRNETFNESMWGEGVEEVFIIHDTKAKEVSEHEFYTTTESGGTMFSHAYHLIEKIIQERYDPANWNIYIFHYSDGDNWGDEDSKDSLETVERLRPDISEAGYIQVPGAWSGSGKFLGEFEDKFGDSDPKIRTSSLEESDPEEYKKVILDMLSKRGDEGDGNE